ncbi:MAG: hypothetical protein EXS51_04315 [Candidatus Taylorbacteria bacterium]|nr:hypothetical protein [Candidatus Taylorbacteria bacterium]
MKKIFLTGLLLLAFPVFVFGAGDYEPQSVGAGNPELHIKQDGTVSLRSGKVDQIVGSTIYFGVRWGDLPIRFTMKTDGKTIVTKRYGGSAAVPQIKQGDYIDVDGDFFLGSDFFGVQALRIKDWSLQEESGTFSGVIVEISSEERFMLRTPAQQTFLVRLATSSATSITKGAVSIPFGRLKKGDAIPVISGVYDYAKNLLTADKIVVYQAKTDFSPRNFEGPLKQVVSAQVPASLIVTVSGVDYTVKISDKTPVQKKNRSAAQLARFVVGDTIRFYGAVRETEKTLQDALIVDAEVIRNLSL